MNNSLIHRGFTLIELLVVITIIVVLLALLTPALDKAIYQAELAACAANQRALGTAVQIYAAQFRRRYPVRDGIPDEAHGRQVFQLRQGMPDRANDMPLFATFLSLNKNLSDPLAPGEVDREGSDDDSFVYGEYSMWFGWKYWGSYAGSFKIGDRFSWRFDYDNDGTEEVIRSRLLVTDVDRPATDDLSLSGHPDRDGLLTGIVRQDIAAIGVGEAGAVKQTINFWTSEAGVGRGELDVNQTLDDGSVSRMTDVGFDAWNTDSTITIVPEITDIREGEWMTKYDAQISIR